MIDDKAYTPGTAFRSNFIALTFTGGILAAWYAINWDWKKTLCVFLIFLIFMAAVALIDYLLWRLDITKERIDISLKSNAHQWAPIAGASMIVGWSSVETNFATQEGSLLILIGLLYSFWCIVVAVDAEETKKNRAVGFLIISHLLAPAVVGFVASWVFHEITDRTEEEKRKDACQIAHATISEQHCRPITPLPPFATATPERLEGY